MNSRNVRSARQNKFRGKAASANSRSLKAVFLIVTEGVTEKNYFEMDCFRDKSVKVEVRQGDKPDPPALLRTADDWLAQLKRSKDLQPGDQAWVVLDEDAATPEQLGEVFQWAAERKDRGVAFSVPAFEVWLLLHYAEAKGVRSQKEVETALKAHWPTFTKTAKPKFTMEQIQQAVSRASRKVGTEYASIEEFDEQVGRHAAVTTVHLLVQLLLASLYRK